MSQVFKRKLRNIFQKNNACAYCLEGEIVKTYFSISDVSEATIADDGAIEHKKSKRKKKLKDKKPVVRLYDCMNGVSMQNFYNTGVKIEDIDVGSDEDEESDTGRKNNYYSTSDEEYSMSSRKRKKKKSKRSKAKTARRPKPKPKGIKFVSCTSWENVRTVEEPFVDEAPEINTLQSFSEICCKTEPLPIESGTGDAESASEKAPVKEISEFYEKFYKNDVRCIPIAPPPYSSHKDSPYYKIKDKKYKHKDTCHKKKKSRSDASKLRELLTSSDNDKAESSHLSIYNNNISSNDDLKVNNINDVYVSSINSPEYEIELTTSETAPPNRLTPDQVTVSKVDAPERVWYTPPVKQDITLESKSDNKVISIDVNNLKVIKEKMFAIEGPDFIEIVHNQTPKEALEVATSSQYHKNKQPSRNYLAHVIQPMDIVKPSSYGSRIEISYEPIPVPKSAIDGGTISSTENTPTKSNTTLTPMKRKNCKYYEEMGRVQTRPTRYMILLFSLQ